MTGFTIGYSDFLADIAEEFLVASHIRYIRTTSGQKLYLPVARGDSAEATQAADDEALEEIRRLVSVANLPAERGQR